MPSNDLMCVFCRDVVILNQPHYWEETGFVKGRSAGGTNALALRQRTGRVAHLSCVDLRRAGYDPQQGTLL
jgi:hypothetical protein